MLGLVVGTIVSAAISIANKLAIAGLAIQAIKMVGNAISMIGKALGIIKPEMDVEEIGDRALQAEEAGKSPEDYESYEAWVRDIERDDWGYDPEKNKDMSPEKKVLKGIEVASGVVVEKYPDLPIEKFILLAENNSSFFTVERMTKIAELTQKDPEAFGKIIEYMTGTIKDHPSIVTAANTLMDIEKSVTPGISDNNAYNKVAALYSLQ